MEGFIDEENGSNVPGDALKKPSWLKITPSHDTDFSRMKAILRKRGLSTVCEEANCPNMAECWHNQGTITMMIMGDTCTRGCKFCAVKTAKVGRPLDPEEPKKISQVVKELGISYIVLTSVDRDDLHDGGAGHFAECIRQIKKDSPKAMVEVLIGDFAGDKKALKKVVDARPEVIAHNIETVKELQSIRDPRANYIQSLKVLEDVKSMDPKIITKSAIMVGLGETPDQVKIAMDDLRDVGCEILTIGQYLKPKNKFLEVREFINPKLFKSLKEEGESRGFLYVASGPFVRSSYKAGELFIESMIKKKRWKDATRGSEGVQG